MTTGTWSPLVCNANDIPRSHADGFDYDGATRSLKFYGACRPKVGQEGKRISVSYKYWIDRTPDPDGGSPPCGGPCPRARSATRSPIPASARGTAAAPARARWCATCPAAPASARRPAAAPAPATSSATPPRRCARASARRRPAERASSSTTPSASASAAPRAQLRAHLRRGPAELQLRLQGRLRRLPDGPAVRHRLLLLRLRPDLDLPHQPEGRPGHLRLRLRPAEPVLRTQRGARRHAPVLPVRLQAQLLQPAQLHLRHRQLLLRVRHQPQLRDAPEGRPGELPVRVRPASLGCQTPRVGDPLTCTCVCAPDCGGCSPGFSCNPASCACECPGTTTCKAGYKLDTSICGCVCDTAALQCDKLGLRTRPTPTRARACASPTAGPAPITACVMCRTAGAVTPQARNGSRRSCRPPCLRLRRALGALRLYGSSYTYGCCR